MMLATLCKIQLELWLLLDSGVVVAVDAWKIHHVDPSIAISPEAEISSLEPHIRTY